ncbi:MAG: hypothetical protein IT458_15470 [Planctomycetes bacterium]|nr:hypothetical protein [Planctomycetota bacterium]
MRSTLLTTAAFAALASVAASQTQPTLVGVTGTTPYLFRQDMSSCQVRACPIQLGPAALPAGGTAYDARIGAVWASNGPLTGAYRVTDCTVVCPPKPLPLITPVIVVVTGLAVHEARQLLFAADTLNQIHVFDIRVACQPRHVSSCRVPNLPAGAQIGGLAVSDVQDLLFYSVSAASGAAGNQVFVAPVASPCAPLCKFDLPACGTAPLGPVTGLAFDDCKTALWATDGGRTLGMLWSRTACSVQPFQCCPIITTIQERLVGLCIVPSLATGTGRNCTDGACPACPSMSHETLGDAALGNASFALELRNAPANAQTVLVVGGGPCLAAGLPVPPFCGPLLVPLMPVAPIVVGPLATGGVGPCDGKASVNLPIPLNPAFCGVTLASQYFVVCRSAVGIGTGVTNCLSWTITAD